MNASTSEEPALESSAKKGEESGVGCLEHFGPRPSKETDWEAQVPSARSAPDTAPLPCLKSEQLNSIKPLRGAATSRHRKIVVALEVQGLVVRYGVERIGFLTFTFKDDVKTIPEASKRMNSLLTNQLSSRYPEWLSVVQRHKDGKIHFHLVVVMAEDIRTGFNHTHVAHRNYASASPYLRAEWKYLRQTLPDFGFGRHELLPVRVPDAFGRYIARYVAGNTKRDVRDRGARLVRYSRSFVRCVVGEFSPWNYLTKRTRRRKSELIMKWPELEEVIEHSWKPDRKWLRWLLWGSPDVTFDIVLGRVDDDLEMYGGVEFALEERAEQYQAALQLTCSRLAPSYEYWPARLH